MFLHIKIQQKKLLRRLAYTGRSSAAGWHGYEITEAPLVLRHWISPGLPFRILIVT